MKDANVFDVSKKKPEPKDDKKKSGVIAKAKMVVMYPVMLVMAFIWSRNLK